MPRVLTIHDDVLAAGETVTSPAYDVHQYGSVSLAFASDKASRVTVEWGPDGTSWDHTTPHLATAHFNEELRKLGRYARVAVTNAATAASTYTRATLTLADEEHTGHSVDLLGTEAAYAGLPTEATTASDEILIGPLGMVDLFVDSDADVEAAVELRVGSTWFPASFGTFSVTGGAPHHNQVRASAVAARVKITTGAGATNCWAAAATR
jgi:hypothetical protein